MTSSGVSTGADVEPGCPSWPPGLRRPRLRCDFGAGLANPSVLGGLPEFREVFPNRASSSAIRTCAASSSTCSSRTVSSSARSPAISSSRCASCAHSSATDGVSGTARSSPTPTKRSSRHADHEHENLTSYRQSYRDW